MPRVANVSPRRHPWRKWFSRRKVTLRMGRDFAGALHGMIATVRNAASRLGVRVSIEAADARTLNLTVVGRLLSSNGKGGGK